jgi:hypothetical protein
MPHSAFRSTLAWAGDKDGNRVTAAALALPAGNCNSGCMSTAEIFKELESLPRPERADVAKRILQGLCADRKAVERVMRRIENPDVPEDVWRGIEDAEDGRMVGMETALREKPPWRA